MNISRGPVQYNFPVYAISVHFGMADEVGSEHAIDGHHFVGEVPSVTSSVARDRYYNPIWL